MILDTVDILIIGGGIAGLATASALAGSGKTIALVDREVVPGFYASGHNAGMARALTGRIEHSRLAVEGRGRLAELGLLNPTGGLLLAMDPARLDALEAEAAELSVEIHRGEARLAVQGIRGKAGRLLDMVLEQAMDDDDVASDQLRR